MADVTIIHDGRVWTMGEDVLTDALAKQIPMEPKSAVYSYHASHHCPVCGNRLKAPVTVDMFKNGSYCDRCGQKINWGDCHD